MSLPIANFGGVRPGMSIQSLRKLPGRDTEEQFEEDSFCLVQASFEGFVVAF